jgi:hypothetical protein
MAACASCTQLASAVVAPAHCGSSANGMATRQGNLGRCVCWCIRCRLVLPHCGFARWEPQRSSACLHPPRATPAHRQEPAASCCHVAARSRSDPVPCAADTRTSRLSRAVGSQCPFSHRCHDHALWRPCHFCDLARLHDGFIPRISATGFLLLGYLCRSERLLVAFFPAFPHLLPFWLSLLLILSSRMGSLSRSERLSFL